MAAMRQLHAEEHWEALLARAADVMPQIEAQHVANICVALAQCVDARGDLSARVCCSFMEAMLDRLCTAPGVKWSDVAAAAWACGKVRYYAPDKLSAMLSRKDLPNSGGMPEAAASQLLLAAATLPIRHPQVQ